MLQGRRRNRRFRAEADYPYERRAAVPSRHRRDCPLRGGARPLGRRRHQRREDYQRTWRPSLSGGRARGCPFPSTRSTRPPRPFRGVPGACRNTVEGAKILGEGLPFIVQTTVGATILASSQPSPTSRTTAWREGLEPLLPGADRARAYVSDFTDAQIYEVLASLYGIQRHYVGRMLVNAKCAPHYSRPFSRMPDGASKTSMTVHQDLLRRGRRVPGRDALHGDPAERGCHALPLPPGLRGTLRRSSLADLWTSSELFAGIRRRSALGGRCGACEMNGHCGGCRARAYGMTGDLMAEDPLCTHTPGKFAGSPCSRWLALARLP